MHRYPRIRPHRTRLLLQGLEQRLAPANFVVTNNVESGAGSLRQAISDSNASLADGPDVITFDASFNVAQSISLLDALPAIQDDVSIIGPGAKLLTITRNAAAGNFRIMTVNNASKVSQVNISGLTLTGGNLVTDGSDQTDNGGGLYISNEIVTLTDVVVSNNKSNAQGGGIAVGPAGQLKMFDCTVSGNQATGDVGGDPLAPGFSGVGGGVYFTLDGILEMTRCTVSGNTAKYRGGGVYLFGDTNAVGILRNCTITKNVTQSVFTGGIVYEPISGGAGIAAAPNPLNAGTVSLTVQNCTIYQNTSSGGVDAKGAGICAPTNRVTTSVTSTIVSNNTGGTGPDIFSTKQITLNNSAVGVQTGFTFTGSNNLAAGLDLKLGALANNGGLTQTNAPAFDPVNSANNSPVIDKGSNPGSFAIDQRGLPRTYNAVDIGAVEMQPVGVPTANAVAADIKSAGGTAATITVTFTDDVAINVSTIGDGDIVVTGPAGYNQAGKFIGLDVNTNGTPRVATYTVPAPGGDWNSADAGTYTIAMAANQVADTGGLFASTGTIGSFKCLLPRTLVVTNKNDSGPGSLRQAILDANSLSPSQDIITFGTLFNSPTTITLNKSSGSLTISDSVKIQGPGATLLTINTNALSTESLRHLIIDGAGILDVEISGILFTGGHTTNNFQSERGGSVYINGENVTMDGVFFAFNDAQKSYGGAIHLQGQASLTFKNGRLVNNSAPEYGGGAISALDAGHTITISNSVINDNKAGYFGGGIMSYKGGTVSIDRCTIAGNQTTTTNDNGGTVFGGGGAGLMMGDGVSGGHLTITNTTFEGNVTAGAGGGFTFAGTTTGFLVQNTSILGNKGSTQTGGVAGGVLTGNMGGTAAVFENCTFANNTAYSGGGLFVANDEQNVIARSCIIAQNFSIDPTQIPPDVDGYVFAEFCLIGNIDGGLLTGSHDNLTGSSSSPLDPLFAGIDTWGTGSATDGPIRLMRIQDNSPAIDAGANPSNLLYDQRGVGFPRVVGKPDIGAYEATIVAPPSVASVTIDDGSAQRSGVRSVTVTFSTLVNLGGGTAEQAFALARTGPGAPMNTVGLSADLAGSTGTQTIAKLTFSGPLSEFSSLIDGLYTMTVFASQVVDAGNVNMAADFTLDFHRLFGDADGDRDVDASDFGAFRTAFGTAGASPFDFDNDGDVDTTDFGQFRTRFGLTI